MHACNLTMYLIVTYETGIIVGPGIQQRQSTSSQPSPASSIQRHTSTTSSTASSNLRHSTSSISSEASSRDFLSNMGVDFNDFAHHTSSLFNDIFGKKDTCLFHDFLCIS